MQYSLNYFQLVQSFCPLRIKITQFPGGFLLNTIRSKLCKHPELHIIQQRKIYYDGVK